MRKTVCYTQRRFCSARDSRVVCFVNPCWLRRGARRWSERASTKLLFLAPDHKVLRSRVVRELFKKGTT